MKKQIVIIFALCFYSSLSAQISFNAFENTSSNQTAIMYGHLKIKTNKSLIIGDQYGSAFPNNGKLRIHNPTGFGDTYIDYRHNIFFRSEAVSGGVTSKPLTLFQNGLVGIGVSQPFGSGILHSLSAEGHKLMVNGSILCEKIKVIVDVPNSDHVFKKGYSLKTLYEIEAYIKKNKHLPEVPSAEEFKENGYNIGEMDDLLLRKIEELTLYVIQLQKEIDSLKKK